MADSLGASQGAIQYHYDVGNDFYATILGDTMAYTAAIWPDDSAEVTLADAQNAKIDWHLKHADVRPGDRLLDIGCGWGGFMDSAKSRAGASQAVGLTLSENQQSWIADTYAGSGIEARLQSWEDFSDARPFDCISAIGVMEYFARPGLASSQKIEAYRRFFEFCYRSLAPRRCVSIQVIVWMDVKVGQEAANLPANLFPESDLPYTHEVVAAAAPYFHLMAQTNRPSDYSKTLRHWLKKLRQNEADLIEAHGVDTVRRYSREFTSFIMGFDRRKIGLTRMQFCKRA